VKSVNSTHEDKGIVSKKTTPESLNVLLIDNDGFSDYTSYLARGLARYHNIVFYGYSENSYVVTGAIREKNIKFYNIAEKLPKGYSTLKGILKVFLLFFELFYILTRTEYNVVHLQEHLPAFFFFIPLLKIKGKKIFWSLHDVKVFSPSKGLSGKLRVLFLKFVCQPHIVTKYSDKIIVHAKSLKEQLESNGVSEKKIHVIPHFDYGYLLYYKSDSDSPNVNFEKNIPDDNILFFGDIAPWKGLEILINAAKIVRKKFGKEFHVLVAGRSFYEDQDNSYYEALNEEERKYIHMYNKWITKSEIHVLLRKSKFLVLPYTEAFKYSSSGVIPLAYTFSKPVISSNIQSLTEYVEHGKTGFIFETGKSEQLANYMIQLLEDDSKCAEMGKNAHEKMIHEMSLERYCEVLSKLYQMSD
jgi:glycosyltransferase involved in cell wall biosynthesis